MILAFLSAGTAAMVEVPESAYGQIGTVESATVSEPATPVTVEEKVRDYFSDIPIMAEVARCESTFTHYLDDGSVLRGRVDNRDTGVMQINTYYHQDAADRLGLDLEDFEENMAFARILYDEQGVQPWNASRPCWGQHHLAMAQ